MEGGSGFSCGRGSSGLLDQIEKKFANLVADVVLALAQVLDVGTGDDQGQCSRGVLGPHNVGRDWCHGGRVSIIVAVGVQPQIE